MKKLLNAQSRIKRYYQLSKPGIIYGNLLIAVGVYLFAAGTQFEIGQFTGLIIGTVGIIASGCVINNYLDRDIDKHMRRTKNRALVTGVIRWPNALFFAAVVGGVGIAALGLLTNKTTLYVGVFGLVSYAFIYTYAKPRTVHATLIGSIPGAVPPIAGYTAYTGRIDTTAFLLGLVLVFWQMVHFYAIAIYRLQEYKRAKIPLMPIVYGIKATMFQIVFYGLLFAASLMALFLYGNSEWPTLLIMVPASIWWLQAILRFNHADPEGWARKVFGRSLVVLLLFSLALAIDGFVG